MLQPQLIHPAYMNVLGYLESSIHSEQIFCSIVTQMTFLPQFKENADLEIIHKENYETSYHRNTAAGNLKRLIGGESDEMLILMTVECFIEARNHDKAAENALEKMMEQDIENHSWVDWAKIWHKSRKHSLRYAAKTLHTLIGPELWAKGAKLAES